MSLNGLSRRFSIRAITCLLHSQVVRGRARLSGELMLSRSGGSLMESVEIFRKDGLILLNSLWDHVLNIG